jgi:hypothetical protein
MRNFWTCFLAFALLVFTASLWAAQIIPTPIPYPNFQAGQTIDPSQVNANFNWLVTNTNNNALAAKAPNTVAAHAVFTPTNATGPVTISNSYNIASINYSSSTHNYTATFTNPLNISAFSYSVSLPCLFTASGISTAWGIAFPSFSSVTTANIVWAYQDIYPGTAGKIDCVTGGYPALLQVIGGY